MGQYYPHPEEFPMSDQIKTLGDDELLDFWEEAQFLERLMKDECGEVEAPAPQDYERIILQELQLRSCQGALRARP